MTDFLYTEIVQSIKKELEKNKTKSQVAHDLKIDYQLVRKHSKYIHLNIESNQNNKTARKYTPEFIRQIRELTRELGVKAEVARRLNIPYHMVVKLTKDIGVRNRTTLGETAMELLKEIINKGYVHLNDGKSTYIYILRKHFPKIEMARYKGKSVAYLPEHKDDAARAMIEKMGKKVWSYQELRAVTKLFDSDLTKREKTGIS